jgi:hypothetical protein
MNDIIELSRYDVELLTSAEFLKLVREHPEQIKSSSIVPPVLGKPGFGGIRVEYRFARFGAAKAGAGGIGGYFLGKSKRD